MKTHCEACDSELTEDGDCKTCEAHCAREREEALQAYDAAKTTIKLPPGAELVLIEKIDCLRPCQWWLWSCDILMPGGETVPAFVQGTEHEQDLSTLELE